MSDPSEMHQGTTVGEAAPRGEEHGGRRKGRGKSRESARAGEKLGDMEIRLVRVERRVIENEGRFEEMDTHMEGLVVGIEEFCDEMQGDLNASIDKLASETETLRHSHTEEITNIREENRILREELDHMVTRMKELFKELVLVKRAIAHSGVPSTPEVPSTIPRRMDPSLLPKLASMGSLQYCSLGALRLVGPSDAPSEDGEQEDGMGDTSEEKDSEECATQEESELSRELPPEEQVGCVSATPEEPPVARSPKVALPKQEGLRQHRSRRSRNRCKAKRRAKTPSHRDEEGTGAQQKAKGNGSQGHERSPRRRGHRHDEWGRMSRTKRKGPNFLHFQGNFDRGGHLWQLTKWARQLANLVANGPKLLKEEQANPSGKIG
ncbi:hypothetical protein P3X46_027164 [Hevea brasiliensis]|uniref:BZIP domain-containing protein n=1 Tax=Hevea brasiliensis TaxID=3981 RepID=A0ABQ9L0F8_HEVBR|nr:hypothetical protein P3X46_027164 [Hevea brasiliensis]